MNDKRKGNSSTNVSSTRNIHEANCELGITDSEEGSRSSKYEQKGVTQQRNIETDVFDWLSKNNETSDKYTGYCRENSTNVCVKTRYLPGAVNSEKESEKIKETSGAVEDEPAMAKRGTDVGSKSYFNAFKNVIFPFEGKYFYLSGDLNNQKSLAHGNDENQWGHFGTFSG